MKPNTIVALVLILLLLPLQGCLGNTNDESESSQLSSDFVKGFWLDLIVGNEMQPLKIVDNDDIISTEIRPELPLGLVFFYDGKIGTISGLPEFYHESQVHTISFETNEGVFNINLTISVMYELLIYQVHLDGCEETATNQNCVDFIQIYNPNPVDYDFQHKNYTILSPKLSLLEFRLSTSYNLPDPNDDCHHPSKRPMQSSWVIPSYGTFVMSNAHANTWVNEYGICPDMELPGYFSSTQVSETAVILLRNGVIVDVSGNVSWDIGSTGKPYIEEVHEYSTGCRDKRAVATPIYRQFEWNTCQHDPWNHSVMTVEERISYNYQICEDGIDSHFEWGKRKYCLTPTFFTTQNVTSETIDITSEWLKIASDEWGNYGPLEVYLISDDVVSAKHLENDFCKNRLRLDRNWNQSSDCMDENNSRFIKYALEGGSDTITYKRTDLAYDFSMIIISVDDLDVNSEEYKIRVLKEYFKHFYHSNILDECNAIESMNCSRYAKLGGYNSEWFFEGSAEFMSLYLYSQQPNVNESFLYNKMNDKLNNSLNMYQSLNLSLDGLSNNDNNLLINMTSWFLAYLIYHEGYWDYKSRFFYELKNFDFELVFERTFSNINKSVYLESFENFLNQTQAQIMSIIPISNNVQVDDSKWWYYGRPNTFVQ